MDSHRPFIYSAVLLAHSASQHLYGLSPMAVGIGLILPAGNMGTSEIGMPRNNKSDGRLLLPGAGNPAPLHAVIA